MIITVIIIIPVMVTIIINVIIAEILMILITTTLLVITFIRAGDPTHQYEPSYTKQSLSIVIVKHTSLMSQ